MQKLILGTAQFGSNYGIKGDGQPSEKEIEKIARIAWDGGIRVIHTSWQYNLPKICEAIFSEFGKVEKCNSDTRYFKWDTKFGLSIYDQEEMFLFEDKVEILQIPINIIDNRFIDYNFHSTWIVIARSVFLQGRSMDNQP